MVCVNTKESVILCMLKWNQKSDSFKVEPDPIKNKSSIKQCPNPNVRYKKENLIFGIMAGVVLVQLILLIIVFF